MTTKQKTIDLADISLFVRENLNRLLLVAVILSGCFALRFAAYGKYVDMINDYTSARAGNFYFSSNYLGKPEDNIVYTLNSFDGENYKLELEIRNYDNAFNYNKKGVDFYYYLTAEVFDDEELTTPSAGYTTTIKYDTISLNNKTSTARDAAQVRMVRSSKTDDGMDNPIIDNSGLPYNDETQYKHLGRILGYDQDGTIDKATGEKRGTAAVREKGKQVCELNLSWTIPVQEKVYVKVSAHTVPPTKTSNQIPPENPSYDDPEEALTIYKLNKADAPNVVQNYDKMVGIYESELTALFVLNPNGSSAGEITKTCIVNRSDYEVTYRLSCTSDVTARVYFNSEKMSSNQDESLLKTDPAKPGYMYYDVRIPANGIVSCYFYRKSLSTEINPDVDFEVTQDTSGGQEEETQPES